MAAPTVGICAARNKLHTFYSLNKLLFTTLTLEQTQLSDATTHWTGRAGLRVLTHLRRFLGSILPNQKNKTFHALMHSF